jgi:DNA-binding CsgD family transcriptional regulator
LAAFVEPDLDQARARTRLRDALDTVVEATNAQLGTVTILERLGENSVRIHGLIEGGEWPRDARDSYMDYLKDDAATDPFLAAVFARAGTLPSHHETLAALRRDLVSDAAWYGSRHYRNYRGAVGIDDCIYAVRPPTPDDGGLWYGMGIHRQKNAGPFGPIEREACDLWLRLAVPWLKRLSVASETAAVEVFSRLTSRQRQVLALLVEGRAAKQIASETGLKLSSVYTYIKGICRTLNVSGQREAVALAVAKGWTPRESRTMKSRL